MCSSHPETSSATSVLPRGRARMEPSTTATTTNAKTASSRSAGRRTRSVPARRWTGGTASLTASAGLTATPGPPCGSSLVPVTMSRCYPVYRAAICQTRLLTVLSRVSAAATSQYGNRVDWRAGPPRQPEGCDDAQEGPAAGRLNLTRGGEQPGRGDVVQRAAPTTVSPARAPLPGRSPDDTRASISVASATAEPPGRVFACRPGSAG